MPRSARAEVAGIHHVTARGNAKQPVFLDAVDRYRLLRLLGRAITDFGWHCLTYCLMGNHYHLLVETYEPTLGAGMHAVNGRYAQEFNLRHARLGHVWANRYHSVALSEDAHLLEAVRYIALNPVRAGLCERPDDWEWSGHRALAGLAPAGLVAVEHTLGYFAARGGDGRQRYAAFVTET